MIGQSCLHGNEHRTAFRNARLARVSRKLSKRMSASKTTVELHPTAAATPRYR
jgi:hypothetical protein